MEYKTEEHLLLNKEKCSGFCALDIVKTSFREDAWYIKKIADQKYIIRVAFQDLYKISSSLYYNHYRHGMMNELYIEKKDPFGNEGMKEFFDLIDASANKGGIGYHRYQFVHSIVLSMVVSIDKGIVEHYQLSRCLVKATDFYYQGEELLYKETIKPFFMRQIEYLNKISKIDILIKDYYLSGLPKKSLYKDRIEWILTLASFCLTDYCERNDIAIIRYNKCHAQFNAWARRERDEFDVTIKKFNKALKMRFFNMLSLSTFLWEGKKYIPACEAAKILNLKNQ